MPYGVKGRKWARCDALRRGARQDKFRMLCFKCAELAQQVIVLGIGNQRRVQHMVMVVMGGNVTAQGLDTFPYV